MKISNDPYTPIIPTAYFTAYPLTLTDIPYAPEIFAALEDVLEAKGESPDAIQKVPKLAPELEARHKLADVLLAKLGVQQVLEIAAGLSTRGVRFTQNPGTVYVELDLPGMIDTKRAALQKLGVHRPNLHLVPGNALDYEALQTAAQYFDAQKEVVVINEGLLRYLSFDEKAIVVQNIRKLLQQFGGVWLTGDITLRKMLANQDQTTMPGKNQHLSTMTGKDFNANSFANEQEAIAFFEKQGFEVEVRHFSEVRSQLSSAKSLGLADDEVDKILEAGRVLVMWVKETTGR